MEVRGVGRALFAAILLTIAGVMNIIYGIGAIDNAHFVDNSQYVITSLHTWGWVTLIIGVVQLTGGFSLFSGNPWGRIVGIFAASIGAIEALMSVGGANPWWSLAIFALCVIVLHGIIVLGEPKQRA